MDFGPRCAALSPSRRAPKACCGIRCRLVRGRAAWRSFPGFAVAPVTEIVRIVVCHSDPERYALLYQLVWRITHGENALPDIASDPLVHRLHRMEKSVRRDLHKMHAFVRFRR